MDDHFAVAFEVEPGEGTLFAHIWHDGSFPFGHAKELKQKIPAGTWVTVPPKQQPGVTWYLIRHVGFQLVGFNLINGELNHLLLKVEG